MEIDGIPKNVGNDPEQLEDAAIKIFKAINVNIEQYNIDTIHRLRSKKEIKPTIIRFVSRKSVREIHKNKGKLRYLADLNIDIPGLTNESRIFVRASQCSYYSNLAFNCRLLKRNGLVAKVMTGDDGRITLKTLDERHIQVNHESVLIENFSNFKGFNFEYNDHEDKERE